MPKFSKKSKEALATCDERLQKVLNFAIKYYDFSVLEGHRSKEKQNEYFYQGKSKLKFPNSKHNSLPSKAVDIAPWQKGIGIDWQDKDRFTILANRIIGIALAMGIELRWGGDFNNNMSTKDSTFFDGPHLEIVEK
jgi:peptidoglycan L-alanyl-D-glutamate endopeptidase CwlK